MPWLKYEVLEVDPEKQAEWEAKNATATKDGKDKDKKSDPPEPEKREHAIQFFGEGHLGVWQAGGTFLNLAIAANGVSKIEVTDEPPKGAELAPQAGDSSGALGAFGGDPAAWKDNIDQFASDASSKAAAGSTKSSTPATAS
jgi:hypothetical protein